MKNQLMIKQYEIGPLNNFLYLLGDPSTKEMAIVDPAWDVPHLLQEAERLGYAITSVFLTHAHPDHVNGLPEVLHYKNIPVYISKHEAPFLTKNLKNLIPIDNNAKLTVGNIMFDVIHTPGHTPGGQCFLTQGQLICGDTLFIDGCGRCDLPGGDARIMYKTLSTIIAKLPPDTIIYPGHNYGPSPTDTIAHQLKTNAYLNCESMDEFLGERMGM